MDVFGLEQVSPKMSKYVRSIIENEIGSIEATCTHCGSVQNILPTYGKKDRNWVELQCKDCGGNTFSMKYQLTK